MERSAIRGAVFPDFASLHPGYKNDYAIDAIFGR
jgi:hypothetical protein